jgi:O-methyltransferase
MNVRKTVKNFISLAGRNMTDYQRYQVAEQLSMAAYPKFKFSDFGRIWLEDRGMLDKYAETMDPGNWHSLDRKYLLKEMLYQVRHLPGDFVECGVYKGASAYWMCKAAAPGRKVHLFDSFEGLPKPGCFDGDHWIEGKFADTTTSEVVKNLEPYRNYHLYSGWIPEIFEQYQGAAISFLHIDVDLYAPTLMSLVHLWRYIIPGGIVICDDYGFAQCLGARQALDQFFELKPENVSSLPTGQALVIKQ